MPAGSEATEVCQYETNTSFLPLAFLSCPTCSIWDRLPQRRSAFGPILRSRAHRRGQHSPSDACRALHQDNEMGTSVSVTRWEIDSPLSKTTFPEKFLKVTFLKLRSLITPSKHALRCYSNFL